MPPFAFPNPISAVFIVGTGLQAVPAASSGPTPRAGIGHSGGSDPQITEGSSFIARSGAPSIKDPVTVETDNSVAAFQGTDDVNWVQLITNLIGLAVLEPPWWMIMEFNTGTTRIVEQAIE